MPEMRKDCADFQLVKVADLTKHTWALLSLWQGESLTASYPPNTALFVVKM